jgi:hypothetical protein
MSLAVVTVILGNTYQARAERLYAVSHEPSNLYRSYLLEFDSSNPAVILNSTLITGGPAGSVLGLPDQFRIAGIDFRPSTGTLYGLGYRSGFAQKLYTINKTTGNATLVSSLFENGGSFGFDFDPVADAIRFTTNTDTNRRINPVSGAVTNDTTLAYAVGDPSFGQNTAVAAMAYTNSVSGAVTTTAYGIDYNLNQLVRIGSTDGSPNSANTGLLTTIGPLGFDLNGPLNTPVSDQNPVAMEISPITGTAYAAMFVGGTSRLYSINLATGAATDLGAIGWANPIYGLAVPEPGSMILLALGLLCLVAMRARGGQAPKKRLARS